MEGKSGRATRDAFHHDKLKKKKLEVEVKAKLKALHHDTLTSYTASVKPSLHQFNRREVEERWRLSKLSLTKELP